jgi:predicted DNA-binding ribbon-helix-helix protein
VIGIICGCTDISQFRICSAMTEQKFHISHEDPWFATVKSLKPPSYYRPAWGEQTMKSTVIKRSIVLAGHKTSLSLEDEFWNAFREIARGRDMSVSDLVGEIDSDRQHANLSSAVRLFVLDFYREQYANYHSRTRKELVA